MYPEDLESELTRLGENWPASSVVDLVAQRLNSVAPAPPVRSRSRRWVTIVGSTAMALAVVAIAWTALLGQPSTLYAQVQEAIRKAKSAHVRITTIDGQGRRLPADLWYSRTHGLRAEAPDQLLVDDGTRQWSWNPALPDAELVVVRRASRDAAGLIAASLQLDGIPADWKQSRVSSFDREIAGEQCVAHWVEPPAGVKSIASGDSSPSRLRFVVWQDKRARVVRVEDQRQTGEAWHTRREIQVEYDIEIPVDKFAVQFPPATTIVDGDALWANRFPLEKALATARAGGLLFALHEIVPCEGQMFFIVSSVRGTPEHLQQYPPRRRHLNLQTTILDVAEQNAGARVMSECHQVALTSDEAEGVHYMWWIAAPRKYFEVLDGKPVSRDGVGVPLEYQAGRVKIPLSAHYRDSRLGSQHENAVMELALPDGGQPRTLVEIAGRARRDALLVSEGLSLYGGIENDTVRILRPSAVTDDAYASELKSQLEWLRSHDRLTDGAAR